MNTSGETEIGAHLHNDLPTQSAQLPDKIESTLAPRAEGQHAIASPQVRGISTTKATAGMSERIRKMSLRHTSCMRCTGCECAPSGAIAARGPCWAGSGNWSGDGSDGGDGAGESGHELGGLEETTDTYAVSIVTQRADSIRTWHVSPYFFFFFF
jgi:hypothetical protein